MAKMWEKQKLLMGAKADPTLLEGSLASLILNYAHILI